MTTAPTPDEQGGTPIVHVPQQHPMGCLTATFAMANGITYQQAKEELGDWSTHCDYWDKKMSERGWYTQRLYGVIQPGNRARSPWPMEPWADLHECEVKTSMPHSVLMLRDGTVLDPLTTEPKRLTDYNGVLSMAALYNPAIAAHRLAAQQAATRELQGLVRELLRTQQSAEQCGNDFFRQGEAVRKVARAMLVKKQMEGSK